MRSRFRPSGPFAGFPARLLVAACFLLAGAVVSVSAVASCLPVASLPGPQFVKAGLHGAPAVPGLEPLLRRIQAARPAPPPAGQVEITFLGHSSFLIHTPGDVAAITDYNGYIRAGFPPDIVTMNRAHSSHYTDNVEPGVAHILRGWDDVTGIPFHDLRLRDTRVRNIPTNIRDGMGGTRYAANSIFIFEVADLCIAHLGHLHHRLMPEHLGGIGQVDVMLVPIDDGMTAPQTLMADVIMDLNPSVVIPMHYYGSRQVQRFLELMQDRGYGAIHADGASFRLARGVLPRRTVLVLAGGPG